MEEFLGDAVGAEGGAGFGDDGGGALGEPRGLGQRGDLEGEERGGGEVGGEVGCGVGVGVEWVLGVGAELRLEPAGGVALPSAVGGGSLVIEGG